MNKLRNHAATMKKQIRFGAGMGLREYVIQNLLRRFTERYPDMRINLMLDTSRHLMMQLENETLDMAVVTNMEDKPGYEYILLENQTFSLAVSGEAELLAQAIPMEGYPHPVISISALKDRKLCCSVRCPETEPLPRRSCANTCRMQTFLSKSRISDPSPKK